MSRERLRFGDFELDPPAYELRRRGKPVKLERIPMDLLLLLVERRGELVTRAEIIENLWGRDVFLEGNTAINTAIGKVRHALRDSAEKPLYVQTVTGKGYRFIRSISGGTDILREEAQRRAKDSESDHEIVLAVLPMADLSGIAGDAYFVDGLTEEMIAALGRVNPRQLQVIARTSIMSYRHSTKPVGQIALELGVDYIVEGSVRRQGGQLRVVARLIAAANQSQLWNASYDRDTQNFLGVQQELASSICSQIQIRLATGSFAKQSPPTRSAAAYDLYLRGRYSWNQLSPPNLRRAIELFQAAVQEDPNYALAYAGIADGYAYLPLISDVAPRGVLAPGESGRRAGLRN